MFSTSSHKRLNAELCRAVVGLVLFFSFVWSSQAGLKIYYIRHAEGGHNVVKQYKNVPKLFSEVGRAFSWELFTHLCRWAIEERQDPRAVFLLVARVQLSIIWLPVQNHPKQDF